MPRDLRLCLHILVSSPCVHFWQYELFSVLSCANSVFRCLWCIFYNPLPTINLSLSRLLTAVPFATLPSASQTTACPQPPYPSSESGYTRTIALYTSHLFRQHACNSPIRQPALRPCRKSCCSVAARLVSVLFIHTVPLSCNQCLSIVCGLPRVFVHTTTLCGLSYLTTGRVYEF